ncbi:uncharacterized protein EI90DRAFT_3153595 [Cantharellus anzutake]|uniref:uncharacterized protein n=1 Tax=Cantharellus anzutake TaxID=1750568 RepID=UPI00190622FA|nr:uncharacterized protein EI90DRAFT_3153595 [Cantharellus anzutake]KAF8334291.1 hypothetical protein EI90DRAFT_3153595 [Cantharellus anzutake]
MPPNHHGATITQQATEHVPVEGPVVDHAISVAVSIVEQAIGFLDILGTDERLTYPSQAIPGGTIGKHIRHVADHYNLLLKAVVEGKLNDLSYDTRSRNTPVETSISRAREELLGLIDRLKNVVPTVPLDEPVTLHAVTPFPAVMQTTFGRELWFTSLHAIHHWSMIRVIAAEQGIASDDPFGVAPSTLESRKGSEGQDLMKSKI